MHYSPTRSRDVVLVHTSKKTSKVHLWRSWVQKKFTVSAIKEKSNFSINIPFLSLSEWISIQQLSDLALDSSKMPSECFLVRAFCLHWGFSLIAQTRLSVLWQSVFVYVAIGRHITLCYLTGCCSWVCFKCAHPSNQVETCICEKLPDGIIKDGLIDAPCIVAWGYTNSTLKVDKNQESTKSKLNTSSDCLSSMMVPG